MTVAVAHQAASSSRTVALREAAIDAHLRQTSLAVLHVVESLDHDLVEAYRSGLSVEIESALADTAHPSLPWQLHLGIANPDVATTLLDLISDCGADRLVIGARHRSPVGKVLMGSITQTVILRADVPVLVVKAEHA